MKKRKEICLMAFAIVAIAITGCSQNKENKQDNKADATVAQINNAQQVDKNASSLDVKSVEGKVNDLTTSDFKKKVMDYEKHPDEWVFEGNRPAIIDFYATWCRPCKMTAPVVEELAKDYQGKIDFYKVDIDKEQELATIFGIQSIPTFLFIPLNGQPTAQMGAMQKEDFEKIIKQVLLK